MSSEPAWTYPAVPGSRLTSDFGARSAPAAGATTMHWGVDIAPPKPGQTGTSLYAAADGYVLLRGYNTARGNVVRIRHSDGSATHYQHLNYVSTEVGVGRTVAVGQVIGTMGSSGIASGPHLHLEVFNPGVTPPALNTLSRNAVDPVPFFAARGVDLRTGYVRPPTPIVPPVKPPKGKPMIIVQSIQTKSAALVYEGGDAALIADGLDIPRFESIGIKTVLISDATFLNILRADVE